MGMPELNIEPDDENQEQTPAITIALRVGATLLGAFIGFASFIGAYLSIVVIDSELVGLEEYVMVRFAISIILWTLLGLFTPFHVITQTFGFIFEFLQGSSGSGRAISLYVWLFSLSCSYSFYLYTGISSVFWHRQCIHYLANNVSFNLLKKPIKYYLLALQQSSP